MTVSEGGERRMENYSLFPYPFSKSILKTKYIEAMTKDRCFIF